MQSQRGHEIYLPASFYTHARYISIKGWRYISDPLYSIRYPLGALRTGHGLHNCHTVLVRLYVNIYLIVPEKGTVVSWGDKQRPDTFKKISTHNFIFSNNDYQLKIWNIKFLSSYNSIQRKMSYSCMYCLKMFISLSKRHVHSRTHTGEKPFPCNQCPKAFSNGGDLKKHLRTHSGEKPFPCNQCPNAFSQGGSLNTYLRTHSGEKPFPGNQCTKAFS